MKVSAEGEFQVLSVTDQGWGLDEAAQSQLFQPFNRLGAERRRIEGSGLGLVIVRDLVHAMGGTIEVISAPQQGAEFRVRLPRDTAKELPKAEPELPRGLSREPPLATSSGTVLYVEDEPLNVLLIQEVFRAYPGWTLHIATDGASGVAMANALQPDLALIDMNLPDIGGLEVLRLLRASPKTAGLCCVALSADALAEQITAARAAGFDDYWTKPIDLANLMPAVMRALQAHARP
ncbi:hybrid sensor histidine kinase/response regulator [Ideonella paludis]|uniref:hybrid sensor histidine kinase/response regulator n=1 Tax=Ideonella paludis TaxID=1233411 RepID=UPI00362934F8